MRRIVSKGLVVLGVGGLIASAGVVGCAERDGASSGASAGSADAAPNASVETPDAEGAVEPAAGEARRVYVNGQAVSDAQLAELERRHGLAIADGRYWYDAASGAAGPEGGPTLAFVVPGLALGGRLAADASRGRTGVFVNGRELPESDLAGLTALVGAIEPGRYFIDALGNAGLEGRSPTLNLLALAQAARAGGGGGEGWYSPGAQAGGNASGGSGYVMGRDASGNVWGASY